MTIQSQEVVGAVYLWTLKNQRRCRAARNTEEAGRQKAMLAGKVKAYTDVLEFIKGRYGKKMVLPK